MADRNAILPAPTKRPADSRVTLAHIMSEHDTNLYGTIHGGVVMKLIDDAAAAAAGRHADGPAVTASVGRMAFLAPMRSGDLLTVHAELERAGRTSMTVGVRSPPKVERGRARYRGRHRAAHVRRHRRRRQAESHTRPGDARSGPDARAPGR
ncbi:acyl-CoA thioesterase [Streptomyces violaceus]|uniref:acyl-CoA thioesterase n=1 Tax=Streptomyces violaceus TaxID=1936 RepID=UPI002E1ECAE8